MTREQPAISEDDALSGCEVVIEDERWMGVPGLQTVLQDVARQALDDAGVDPSAHALSIGLMDDQTVRGLNAQFRGQDKATNVLSFPSPTIGSGHNRAYLGDIAIAFETAETEAKAEGKPLRDHVAHLVVHGVLHLCGHDHDDESDAERMEHLERAILAKFQIPDPYRDAELASHQPFLS